MFMLWIDLKLHENQASEKGTQNYNIIIVSCLLISAANVFYKSKEVLYMYCQAPPSTVVLGNKRTWSSISKEQGRFYN